MLSPFPPIRKLPAVITCILAVALLPMLRAANLPFSLEWRFFIGGYLFLLFQSVMMAGVMWFIQWPKQTIAIMSAFADDPKRLAGLALFCAALSFVIGIKAAIICTAFALVVALAFLAIRDRRAFRGLIEPGIYLFFGLLLSLTFSNIIVRLRFFAAYDAFFNSLDAHLFGITVPFLARLASAHLPGWVLSTLDFTYFGMFIQIGVALVLCALAYNRENALRFVASILVAYLLALAIFALWPSYGPYYLDPEAGGHAAAVQRVLLSNARYLSAGNSVSRVPIGYYIAFPSLHIAQPIIVLWFVRKWRRIAVIFAAYDLVLLAAIILLELHYLVDLIGGALVAFAAIAACEFGKENAKEFAATATS